MRPPLDAATVRQIAVLASVDPRTVLRALRGEPVRGMPGHRIRAVLQAEGLLPAEQREKPEQQS